ncbi:MAG: Asp-tRNA(Asn)/Glu-tRNA(Gln) amidotransferase subunit GatC [Lewinellaceae bacterium]|nr:Asp-tRNA(Asn)/Glu-tRNA(Gln) amidotransferase subunit GatC [Lewinellaceae bacterium]
MEVNKVLISKLEKLARLQLEDTERERLQTDLGKMLDLVEQLRELPTDGVAPLIYLNAQQNVFREDLPIPSSPVQQALRNAPDHDDQYFRVPKVII